MNCLEMWTFIVLFVSVILTWAYLSSRKPKKFPPGPPRLPLVGSALFISDGGTPTSIMCSIIHQVKKYGKICGFYLGSEPVVVLSDFQLIKEAYKLDSLSGRPRFITVQLARPGSELVNSETDGGSPGVIFAHGKNWKELRRFLLRNLREFGFGKSSMEEMFQEEVMTLCKHFEKKEGQHINLAGTMNISIVNALWCIITGQRLDINDPGQQRVVTLINNFIVNITLSGNNFFASFLPKFMIRWPVFDYLSGYKVQKDGNDAMVDLISPYIEEHEKTLDPDNLRDFLDLMLLELQAQKNADSCFNKKLGKMTIINSLLDLFLAGMETTSSSIVMSVLHLLHHPDVQKKVHEELDRVVGRERLPNLEDKDQLPYISAVLQESFRVTSLFAIGVPHFSLEEIEFHGYTIPKGSVILSSIYNVGRDPEHFPDPETFNPDRFIDTEGKFVPNERVIPFGIGKRYCLGQSLAEKEFYIFFTALLQKFEFQKVPGKALPSYTNIRHPVSFVRVSHPFEVILQKRF